MQKVNVLGTIYEITESNLRKDKDLDGVDGYCDTSVKSIVIDELRPTGKNDKKDLPGYKKAVKRHELTHAFLFESGLDVSSWANNEELVDWIALQFPKMMEAFKEVDCI